MVPQGAEPRGDLRETVGRVRHAGAKGDGADSGFYTHAIVAVCRKLNVRFSITIRQSQSLRSLIEAISEADWTPVPYWMDGAADVAETSYTPFQNRHRCGSSSGGWPTALNWPCWPPTAITDSSPTGMATP